MTPTLNAPVLEQAAQAFVEATNNPPYLFDRPPAEGRKQAVGFVSEALSTRA